MLSVSTENNPRLLWYANGIHCKTSQQELQSLVSSVLILPTCTEAFISSKLNFISGRENGDAIERVIFSDLPSVEWELHLPPSEEGDCYIQLFFLHRTGFPTVACEVIYHRSFQLPSPHIALCWRLHSLLSTARSYSITRRQRMRGW